MLRHIGIILDGNRRWAKERNKPSLYGHKAGAKNLKELAFYIFKEKKAKILSVFAFSTENFKRSEEEVSYLQKLLLKMLKTELDEIKKLGVKIVISGRKENLSNKTIEAIEKTEKETQDNKEGIFNICLNYGGCQEIVDASKKIASLFKENKIDLKNLNEENFYKYLYNDLGPIDLLIRTSDEERISNFMLYNLAYSEFYFTPLYFPDFNIDEFNNALLEFDKRKRRFGK